MKNNAKTLQYAMTCVSALQQQPGQSLPIEMLCKKHTIPVEEIGFILAQFERAGIAEMVGPGLVRAGSHIEGLSPLDILTALWPAPNPIWVIADTPQAHAHTCQIIGTLSTPSLSDDSDYGDTDIDDLAA